MLSREETERLAAGIHGLRPEWPIGSLCTFIWERRERPLLSLTVELAWVAQLPDTRSPARADQDGPWKLAVRGAQPANASNLLPVRGDDDCRECGQAAAHPSHFDESEHGCTYLSPSAWAERANAADHHAKAAEIRRQLANERSQP